MTVLNLHRAMTVVVKVQRASRKFEKDTSRANNHPNRYEVRIRYFK